MKQKAVDLLFGSYKEQYSRLWDYCNILRCKNPGSIARLKVERPLPSSSPLFQRMFVYFDAMRKGMSHCRPFLGLDGCHLYGPYKGILLSTIVVDANNQQFPVCAAVVEVENKHSWAWFLTNVVEALDTSEVGWAFMSDRQKVTYFTPFLVYSFILNLIFCITLLLLSFRACFKQLICWLVVLIIDIAYVICMRISKKNSKESYTKMNFELQLRLIMRLPLRRE